jgi:uncharacterized protein GlcG (DUF336 family)
MITLAKAKEAITASEAKAKELGITVSTAIVDEHGVLLAFSRMDSALNISPRFSQAKAHTSAALGLPSADVANYVGEGKPYMGAHIFFTQEWMVVPGGLPVKENGLCVGAVGVGGSMDVNQDVECAQVAVDVLEGTTTEA